MYRYAPSKKERKPGLGFARQRFNWITCLPRFRWIVARTATPYPKAYLVPKGSAVGNFDTPGNENRVRSGARFAFRDTKANCTSSCETARASSQDHVTKREVSPRYLTKLRERVDVRRERERERERAKWADNISANVSSSNQQLFSSNFLSLYQLRSTTLHA